MENIQAMMKELFGNSCLAYCYAYIAHPSSDVRQLTSSVLKGWSEHNIDDDGFVSKPVQYYNSLMPANNIDIVDVVKVNISSLNELPEKEMFSVEFRLTPDAKEKHFAVCVKGKIIFDPSGESNTCKNGIPVSYRKFVSYPSVSTTVAGDWIVHNKEPL